MILQILDSSHAGWVQGGTFKDLRNASAYFDDAPMYLSPFPKGFTALGWFKTLMRIPKGQDILFSSMTPAENFFRVRDFMRHSGTLGLWFTHKDGNFSRRELSTLRKMDLIFVHSLADANHIQKITSARVIQTLGALAPSRFSSSAKHGRRIVWVGTPVDRKRPELLIEMIKRFPQESFLILGKGWEKSIYWPAINSKPNVQYRELHTPLTSSDLDGCDIYLMTSRIEGGPMPLMECIAAGLRPVIATKTGFTEDVLKICGLPENYPGNNIENIMFEIQKMRSQNELSREASRNAILEYSFDRQARVIANAYRETYSAD